MANRTKTAKAATSKTSRAETAGGRRQLRLGFGLIFLLAGAFVCLAIVSYFFTWRTDQDALLNAAGAPLQPVPQPAANWGGRIGAWLSHLLVYRGFGLASLAAGLWLALTGLSIVYGKRAAVATRYLRWAGLVVLVLSPILTYLFPASSFPWGGAWGAQAIAYLNLMIGTAGTGLVLAGATFFVLFVILALDVTPLIRRARASARRAREAMLAAREQLRAEDAAREAAARTARRPEVSPVLVPDAASAEPTITLADEPSDRSAAAENGLTGESGQLQSINESFSTKRRNYDLAVQEKAAAERGLLPEAEADEASGEPPFETGRAQTAEPVDEEEAEFQRYLSLREAEKAAATARLRQQEAEEEAPGSALFIEEPEAVLREEAPRPAAVNVEGLSFEVVQQVEERPAAAAVAHGAHISIENAEPYAPELDLPGYRYPTLDLLEDRSGETVSLDKEELEKNKNQIIQTLRSFGIEIQRISATVGPTVTLYEIVPAEGVRISKIRNLEDDIALNLAALGIRIIAPIPGRGTIGIEVPNANKQIVSMRALLSSEKFVTSKMSLPIALGKKIDNENYIVDLATMPHLLMAGATGQGKSVGINAILVSLLYKKHPSQLKFVMVDPKKVELSVYRLIEKHFLAKLPNEEEAIITDTKKVINTLNALCIEMDNRYELLKEAGTRNIKEYNEKFMARRLNPEKGHKFLPFIVLVVDEFADLIMTAGKEVEMPIARLAQLARAVGIHLIVATQRPSVNVITGTIKANFPARIAFKVSAKVDSRTILDAGGAEQLVGRGDMLVSHGSELLRLQCAFVDTPEVEEIVEFIGKQRGYPTAFELPEYEGEDGGDSGKNVDLTNRDKLFEDCARTVVSTQSGSTSNLQRKFNLGYNRAGRIMDQLEAAGIVGPAVGSKPREVYYQTEHELEQFLDSLL